MKDERGLFYYPFPQNKKVRMYVKREQNAIWFRLWNQEDEKLWDDHGWVPYDAVKKAIEMYEGGGPFDPNKAYDIETASYILKENG